MVITKVADTEFRQAILCYVDDLYRFAWSLCHNSVDSEDLVSETVLKALELSHTLSDQSKLKQWMLRMIYNSFIDQRRRAKRVINISTDLPDSESQAFSLYEQLLQSTFTDNNTPEVELINKMSSDSIQNAIRQLPQTFRVAFVLCDVEELSYQEIAVTLNINVGTVRSRIARARSMLQKLLWQQALESGVKIKAKSKKKEVECNC